MLVHRPDFDRRAWVLSFLLRNGPLKFFLTALDPSPSPLRGWRGRGFWIESSIPTTSASQPR
jgi:hypothetical protein